MLPFTLYILKVIICSAILFTYYWCLLRNKVFHQYNRFYLLAIIVLSLSFPLFSFTIWQSPEAPKTQAIQLLEVVNAPANFFTEDVQPANDHFINTDNFFFLIFCAISTAMLLFFLKSLYKIYALERKSPFELFRGIKLLRTNDDRAPFSFLQKIFWNVRIELNSIAGQRILQHELAHVNEKHSYDKIFLNIVMTVFWCNPVFWLLKSEMELVHEFIADDKVIKNGDTAELAEMILQAAYPTQHINLSNPFFYSPIKRRILMLTKNNHTRVNYFGRLLALPLVLCLFAAFTLKSKTFAQGPAASEKIITVVLDAGHGGTDLGATNTSGLYEKDLALSLVQKVKTLNKNPNIKILLTRDVDVYKSPREKRLEATSISADAFISIHINNGPQKEQVAFSGAMVYVANDEYNNSFESKLLASAIIGTFQSGYGLPVVNVPVKSGNIWVLKADKMPSILIEAAWMNNKKDLAYISSAAGQQTFAEQLLQAIENYASGTIAKAEAVNRN